MSHKEKEYNLSPSEMERLNNGEDVDILIGGLFGPTMTIRKSCGGGHAVGSIDRVNIDNGEIKWECKFCNEVQRTSIVNRKLDTFLEAIITGSIEVEDLDEN